MREKISRVAIEEKSTIQTTFYYMIVKQNNSLRCRSRLREKSHHNTITKVKSFLRGDADKVQTLAFLKKKNKKKTST